MAIYRNATEALVYSLHDILEHGEDIVVRGSKVKEVTGVTVTLMQPEERCFVLPFRNDNIFHKIAESMWVMSGSDDATWLTHYLPRALDFSDDGYTWRAAYGKRLRHYNAENDDLGGVDQIAQCANLLNADPTTRRAAMTIFNPQRDWEETKDVPCNNWIHWLIRDGKLQMHVAQRSSDIMWGFSGINTFEWSILHTMMAHWCGVKVGVLRYFISSLHLYEKHFERAEDIVNNYTGLTIYHHGVMPADGFSIPVDTDSLDTFDGEMADFMTTEKILRTHPETYVSMNADKDPFMTNCLDMLAIYDALQMKINSAEIIMMLTELPDNDFKLAAVQYCERALNTHMGYMLREHSPMLYEAYMRCMNRKMLKAA